MANVLAVVAHPDDEVLGCGGTLWKHHENGDLVVFHFMTNRDMKDQISSAWPGCTFGEDIPNPPDQQFDILTLNYFTQRIEQVGIDPDIIYTHWPHDLNLDHAITARAVLTVFRPKPNTKPRKILAFETLSSTEWSHGYNTFSPNYYVPLTEDQIVKKLKSMFCYKHEIKDFPHPRSEGGILARAHVRGIECGHSYAEAFYLVRCVEG